MQIGSTIEAQAASNPGTDGAFAPPELSALDLEDQARQAAAAELSRQNAVVVQLRRDYSWFTQERTRYETRWNECYRMYRVQSPDERKSGEWRSKVAKPYAFTSVEDALPHYMKGLIATDKPFKLISEVESEEMLEAHETLLKYQTEEQIGMEERVEECLRQALIYGSSPVYTGWRNVMRKKKMWVKQQSDVDPTLTAHVIQEFEVPDYVGNTFEVIDLWNVYPHPRSTRDNFIKMFWDEWRPIEWIQQFEGVINLDQITDEMASQPNSQTKAEVRQFETGSGNTATSGSSEKVFKVTTCFDDIAKRWYVMVNEKVLIYEGDYPFFHGECPITWFIHTPMAKEFYGLGLVEQMAPLVHLGNTTLNARMDNLLLSINQMMEVADGEIEDEQKELVFRPFGIVHSKSGQAVRPIEFPMVTQDSRAEERQTEADINHITGLGGTLAGQQEGSVNSGTGVSLLQKAQLLRMEYAIRRAGRALAKIYGQMFENNMQFYPNESVRAVLGPKMFANWQEYQPDNITCTAKVIVEPAGLFANDDVLRQQFGNLLNILGANPATAPKLDWDYLTKKGLKLYGETDPERALKKHGTMNIMEYMYAHQENLEMSNGTMIPPATPQDDEQIHQEIHMTLAAARPDLMQGPLGQHLLSHEQAIMMRQQMLMQAQMGEAPGGPAGPQKGQNGPGSSPAGNKGGVNHNRQPQPTGQQSIGREVARMGRK